MSDPVFPQIDQRFVDHIVQRAQNSMMGLGDPKSTYSLKHYGSDFESVALILVNAHTAKYDLTSLMLAAMEEAYKLGQISVDAPPGPRHSRHAE